MAIEIKAKVSKALYDKIKERIEENDLLESEYIINLITDDLFSDIMADDKEGEECDVVDRLKKCDVFDCLKNRQFSPDQITELFLILAQKMSTKEKVIAQKLLKHFEQKNGIYELPPKSSQAKKIAEPDAMGVSDEAAEEVINEQGSEVEIINKWIKKEAAVREERNTVTEVSQEPLVELDDPNDYDEENEENDDYKESGDEEFFYEEDEENETENLIETPTKDEVKEFKKKETEIKIMKALEGNVEAVDDFEDDPDSDVPNWTEDDPVTMEEKSVGIKEDESEKVINSAPGLSAPVKPKKPKILTYDPNNANNSNAVLGPYANHSKRVKTTKTQTDIAHGAHLLQQMGVDNGTIKSVIRSRNGRA